MDIWHINGGRALHGSCFVQGSKNAALPILAASLISPSESELVNVPVLSDVDAALRILRHLGCKAEQYGNDVYINSAGVSTSAIPHSLMLEMRSSVIFMGALLARCGEARLSLPGGCQLGRRPIDIHLSSLRKMGAVIDESGGEIYCRAERLRGTELFLPFPSVGATENIMLASASAEGETVIHGAAREPEIEALQNYLQLMGMRISGAGTDTIYIEGFEGQSRVGLRIIPDRIAASTLACAAAAVGGNVELRGVNPEHFSTVIYFLNQAGCDIITKRHTVRIASDGKLNAAGNICTAPYPGFPTDAQPVLMAALLKANGKTVITENIFENRYRQAEDLMRLGADISISGKRAEIRGVEGLLGTHMTATDLRGGAAMIIGGLCAEGESLVYDNGHICRGYERLDSVLCSLGADIYIQ